MKKSSLLICKESQIFRKLFNSAVHSTSMFPKIWYSMIFCGKQKKNFQEEAVFPIA